MLVFVDFDNLDQSIKSRELRYVVDRILSAIGVAHLKSDPVVRMRLYGGWYFRNRFSHQAQQLVAQVQVGFPSYIQVGQGFDAIRVKTLVELAFSLEAEPNRHLLYTYRDRASQTGLRCEHPSEEGCL